MLRQRTSELTAAEILRLAGELDTLSLTFPQEPSGEVEAAAWTLREACQRFAAACISPCHLMRLPDETLLRVLCELTSRDLSALACSCHALSDGSPCSLIDRGAHDALNHQYSSELAVLPPQNLRGHARLRWLERRAHRLRQWRR
mgnify:CR=1 FL=1